MGDLGTKDRILKAASQVFCEKGFENTTIRDICALAEANVAAVNYHFGDKQKLYHTVMADWMRDVFDNSERFAGLRDDSTPRERLQAYIRADLKGLLAGNDRSQVKLRRARMVLREIASDTHNPELLECHKQADLDILRPIVSEVLGEGAADAKVYRACQFATSIMTQMYIVAVHDPEKGLVREDELEDLTDMVTTYVMGGLHALKETLECEAC